MSEELKALAGEAAAADALAAPVVPDAGSVAGRPTAPAQPEANPEAEALTLVELIEGAVKAVWPVLDFPPEAKQEGAKRLAPLLVKYNAGGSVFGRWGHEIAAGMFFGGMAFQCYKIVQEDKAEKQKPGGQA